MDILNNKTIIIREAAKVFVGAVPHPVVECVARVSLKLQSFSNQSVLHKLTVFRSQTKVAGVTVCASLSPKPVP